jgi:hypothetical protein
MPNGALCAAARDVPTTCGCGHRPGAINIDWLELHQGSFLSEKSNSPGAADFGIQMAHRLLNMRDFLIATKSSNDALAAHAAKCADGSIVVQNSWRLSGPIWMSKTWSLRFWSEGG